MVRPHSVINIILVSTSELLSFCTQSYLKPAITEIEPSGRPEHIEEESRWPWWQHNVVISDIVQFNQILRTMDAEFDTKDIVSESSTKSHW